MATDTHSLHMGVNYEHMERRMEDQLRHINSRLDDMVKATEAIARNEERMNSLTSRTDRLETNLEVMERDFYGPDGILVRVTRDSTKSNVVLAGLLTLGSLAVQLVAAYIGG